MVNTTMNGTKAFRDNVLSAFLGHPGLQTLDARVTIQVERVA